MKDIVDLAANGFKVLRIDSKVRSSDVTFDQGEVFKRQTGSFRNPLNLRHCFLDKLRLHKQVELNVPYCKLFDKSSGNKTGKASQKYCLRGRHVRSILAT